jgi:hypothetical protein
VPGETSFEFHPEKGAPEIIHAPSAPRYVAVDDEHVYWTNTGPLAVQSPGFPPEPVDDAGTIGRATIGEPKAPDPAFITGAADPQGIAVNATHLYWANAARSGNQVGIARANIEDDSAKEIDQRFFSPSDSLTPFGVALDANYVYFTTDNIGSNVGLVVRHPLEGKTDEREGFISGNAGVRGIALDGTNLFWVSESEHTIGRIPIADFLTSGECSEISTCQKEFLGGSVASLSGLAAGPNHLYFSTNGETPPNPGNDLYRYDSTNGSEPLTDLTPDSNPGEENGAEVMGVLGASPDGSYLYFVANGDLDEGGEALPGDCEQNGDVTLVSGECNLYLWHQGQSELIARLRMKGPEGTIWAPTEGVSARSGAKSSFLSADGRTLLFLSSSKLTESDNGGTSQFYRFRVGEDLTCVSCNPTGAPSSAGSGFQGFNYPGSIGPNAAPAALELHLLSENGNQAFFSTQEALTASDTNSAACTAFNRKCEDVYEWEAPGSGTCTESTPAYSLLNAGCLYLLSTGTSESPAELIDASPSGSDVYFRTRDSLVGQDTDSILDIYDARVGGGLAAQNPIASSPCEAEGCKGPVPAAPSIPSPPDVSGPPDPTSTRHGCRAKKARKGKGGCGGHGKKHHGKHKPGRHRHGGAHRPSER